MAKMNIYVPDDLKRQMAELTGLNWSAVACHAFRGALGLPPGDDTASRLDRLEAAISDLQSQLRRHSGESS